MHNYQVKREPLQSGIQPGRSRDIEDIEYIVKTCHALDERDSVIATAKYDGF